MGEDRSGLLPSCCGKYERGFRCGACPEDDALVDSMVGNPAQRVRLMARLAALRARLAEAEGEHGEWLAKNMPDLWRERGNHSVAHLMVVALDMLLRTNTDAYDRGHGDGYACAIQLRNQAERRAGAEAALREAWENPPTPAFDSTFGTRDRWIASRLATLFPEATDGP